MLSKDRSSGGIFLLGPNMLSANVSLSTGKLQHGESWIFDVRKWSCSVRCGVIINWDGNRCFSVLEIHIAGPFDYHYLS